jgi:hypothetical protein
MIMHEGAGVLLSPNCQLAEWVSKTKRSESERRANETPPVNTDGVPELD